MSFEADADRGEVPRALRTRGLEMPWNRVLAAVAEPAHAATALGPWYPQEFRAECVETIPECQDSTTFVFRRTDGAPLAFRAGQYLNIDFPVDGEDAEPISRSYSLSSAPTAPWTFAVTVRRDPTGVVSSWAHANIRPGMILDMLGPVGAFHLPDHDRRARYLFLAAGSGITPIMSMIRTIHSLPGQADVCLLYHGASPERFAFVDELDFLEKADFRFRTVYSLGDRVRPEGWGGRAGRISAELIDAVAPDANGRQVYACGPQGYLDQVLECLPKVGVDDTSVFVEHFSGDISIRREYAAELAAATEFVEDVQSAAEEITELQVPALDVYDPAAEHPVLAHVEPAVAVDAEASASVPRIPEQPEQEREEVGVGALTMSFLRSGLDVRIDPDQNILQAARASGVRIGANCQEGMCGSCKVVKLEGDVDMHHQGGIRAREIAAGKFLPCCSTAVTDLVIDA